MDDGAIPSITLGGKVFPVPLLAIKQNRHVLPALLEMTKQPMTVADITQNMDRYLDPIYWAVTRGTPDFKREDLEDMPVTGLEILQAIVVVIKQSGFFDVPAAAPGDGDQQGEAQAAA